MHVEYDHETQHLLVNPTRLKTPKIVLFQGNNLLLLCHRSLKPWARRYPQIQNGSFWMELSSRGDTLLMFVNLQNIVRIHLATTPLRSLGSLSLSAQVVWDYGPWNSALLTARYWNPLGTLAVAIVMIMMSHVWPSHFHDNFLWFLICAILCSKKSRCVVLWVVKSASSLHLCGVRCSISA